MLSPAPRPLGPREPAMRAALKAWLADRAEPEVSLVDELGIKHGKFRVDVAAIGAALHGYEIKSDQDTVKRLPAQAKHFSLVFHRMTLVVGPGLLGPALTEVPPWWGVLLMTLGPAGEVMVSVLREGQENPKPNYRWVVRLLWRAELSEILRAHGVRGYSKLKYWEIANLMLATFPPEELTAQVCRTLQARKGQPPASDAEGPAEDYAWGEPDPSDWGHGAWGEGGDYLAIGAKSLTGSV